ncbi:MAG: ParA family protein [Christensenellaceae bacterium]|nr:ParA family protein [Christensenellaceae bacterium]
MIYAVINQKGGVGKTTTASALIAGLAQRGRKCLAIDTDPQCNLTSLAGITQQEQGTILGVLMKETDAASAVKTAEKYSLLPSSPALSGADAFIVSTGREYRLKEAIRAISGQFDDVVIDTPPTLGILTINALTACDQVIIPAQADLFSLQGIEQLFTTIEPVKKYCNPHLEVAGILLTRFNSRTILSKEIAELASQIANRNGTRLFAAKIREATSIKEAQILRRNIFDYAPNAKVAEDYNNFIDELLDI